MPESNESNFQRWLILVLAIVLMVWGGIGEITSTRIGISVSNAALLRVGFVLFACWIAYPVIRRPAAWLPAGATTFGILLIGAVVFNPKLLIILIPLFSALLALGAIVRSIRSKLD